MTEDEVEQTFDSWLAGEREKQANDQDSDIDFHAVYECCLWIGWKAAHRTLGKLADTNGGSS